MDVQFPETLAEALVLIGSQVLVTKEENLVLEERLSNFLFEFCADGLGEVHAADLGPENPGEPFRLK